MGGKLEHPWETHTDPCGTSFLTPVTHPSTRLWARLMFHRRTSGRLLVQAPHLPRLAVGPLIAALNIAVLNFESRETRIVLRSSELCIISRFQLKLTSINGPGAHWTLTSGCSCLQGATSTVELQLMNSCTDKQSPDYLNVSCRPHSIPQIQRSLPTRP